MNLIQYRKNNMLNREYPAPSPEFRTLLVALVFGLFIWLFLWFFEPFGIDVASGKDPVFSLAGFGLISALVLIFYLFFLPLFLPRLFSDKHWRVKHQILLCFAILFTIATLNGLFTDLIKDLPFRWRNYGWIIVRTFALGGIPFSFLILFDMQKKSSSNQQVAQSIQIPTVELVSTTASTPQTIATDLKTESFKLDEAEFLYAMAIGNYIECFRFRENQIRANTYRISLSAFEKQIQTCHLIRCHRSFLVNLMQVSQVTGNAQGLKLHLRDTEITVPVSRKYISAVRGFFAKS